MILLAFMVSGIRERDMFTNRKLENEIGNVGSTFIKCFI